MIPERADAESVILQKAHVIPEKREIRKLNPWPGFLYELIERRIRERMLRNLNHKTFVRRREK